MGADREPVKPAIRVIAGVGTVMVCLAVAPVADGGLLAAVLVAGSAAVFSARSLGLRTMVWVRWADVRPGGGAR